MKKLAIILCFVLAATGAVAATYQWTDKEGVVHYTDNPDRISPQYQQKALERDVTPLQPLKSETPRPEPAASPSPPPAVTGEGLYCGAGAAVWQKRFKNLRDERRNLDEALPEMEKELKRLRIKSLSRTGSEGYYTSKKQYVEQAEQFKLIQARSEDLDKRIADLEMEAARCGVPLHLRQ
jgi:hypothetical protein